jgi:hypothetical protein
MKSPEHRSRSPFRHHHRSNIPILFDCTGANHSSINHQADEGEADKAELAERESRRSRKRQELVRFDLLTVRSGMRHAACRTRFIMGLTHENALAAPWTNSWLGEISHLLSW